jgi:hypothetical protein
VLNGIVEGQKERKEERKGEKEERKEKDKKEKRGKKEQEGEELQKVITLANRRTWSVLRPVDHAVQ